MTMIPFDPSVDVRRRLTDLHTWQTEWQRIDRALEERLLGLDGTKLVELRASGASVQSATTDGHDPGENAPHGSGKRPESSGRARGS